MENGIGGRENKMLTTWRKGKAKVIGVCKCFDFRRLKDTWGKRARSETTELG